jgi:hypothetical protein
MPIDQASSFAATVLQSLEINDLGAATAIADQSSLLILRAASRDVCYVPYIGVPPKGIAMLGELS